jgi:hypothetical protein
MLKITAKQLIESTGAFAEFASERITGNQKLAYNIGKTWKQARAEVDALKEQEINILKNFGAKEADAGRWSVDWKTLDDQQKADLKKQREDLNAIEIELWGNQITLEEIEKAKINLSPSQFDLLSWLIVETIEPAPAPVEG